MSQNEDMVSDDIVETILKNMADLMDYMKVDPKTAFSATSQFLVLLADMTTMDKEEFLKLNAMSWDACHIDENELK